MLAAPYYIDDRNNNFKIMLHYFKWNVFPKKKKGLLTIWYWVPGLLNVDAKYISA